MPEETNEETWETETAAEKEAKFASLEIGDDLVFDLPSQAGSLYAEAVGKLIELQAQSEVGGWLRIGGSGRGANSVQAGLQTAAKSLGVKVKTRTRTEDGAKVVYVALKTEDDTEDATDDGGESEE